MLQALRSGVWLTRQRIVFTASLLLLASLLAIAWLLATSNGLNDAMDRPLGTDFSNIYAAGTYVKEGRPAAPFDMRLQHQREREIFGEKTPFYGWHYPPFFLASAGALAQLPYLAALTVWQAGTFMLYLLVCRRVTRDEGGIALLLMAAYPAVLVNTMHGHNGFLSAALLGGALWLLPKYPVRAGILIGLLAYKPQLGLLIPLALIAGNHWRSFFTAALTVLSLVLATTLAWGEGIWEAFLHASHFTRDTVLEQGDTGWHKIQSLFSCMRMWGGSVELAYAAQGILVLFLTLTLWRIWRGKAAHATKAAALCVACFLASPYVLDYDMMVIAPTLCFLIFRGMQEGFHPWEKTVLAMAWLSPCIARSLAETLYLPAGLLSLLALYVVIARRAAHEHSASPAV